MKLFAGLILLMVALSGCSKSSDYTPTAGMSGADIFMGACLNCHKTEGGVIFSLDKNSANLDAVSAKILKGSMMMPSFPNIQGEELTSIAAYVLKNSTSK